MTLKDKFWNWVGLRCEAARPKPPKKQTQTVVYEPLLFSKDLKIAAIRRGARNATEVSFIENLECNKTWKMTRYETYAMSPKQHAQLIEEYAKLSPSIIISRDEAEIEFDTNQY